MLSSPNAMQLPRISAQIFNHDWFVVDIFPGFPERKNKPAFWREALLLVFTAVSHLFKEQFLLRRSREQHELQPRYTPGSPPWEDGSSSSPALQPGPSLHQLRFFR